MKISMLFRTIVLTVRTQAEQYLTEKIMTGVMSNAQMVIPNIKQSVLRREELMLIIIIIRLSFEVILKVTLVSLA